MVLKAAALAMLLIFIVGVLVLGFALAAFPRKAVREGLKIDAKRVLAYEKEIKKIVQPKTEASEEEYDLWKFYSYLTVVVISAVIPIFLIILLLCCTSKANYIPALSCFLSVILGVLLLVGAALMLEEYVGPYNNIQKDCDSSDGSFNISDLAKYADSDNPDLARYIEHTKKSDLEKYIKAANKSDLGKYAESANNSDSATDAEDSNAPVPRRPRRGINYTEWIEPYKEYAKDMKKCKSDLLKAKDTNFTEMSLEEQFEEACKLALCTYKLTHKYNAVIVSASFAIVESLLYFAAGLLMLIFREKIKAEKPAQDVTVPSESKAKVNEDDHHSLHSSVPASAYQIQSQTSYK